MVDSKQNIEVLHCGEQRKVQKRSLGSATDGKTFNISSCFQILNGKILRMKSMLAEMLFWLPFPF